MKDVENFKKLNVISKDEFDTLTPKVPVDPNQEVPPPPMPGGAVELSCPTLLSFVTRAAKWASFRNFSRLLLLFSSSPSQKLQRICSLLIFIDLSSGNELILLKRMPENHYYWQGGVSSWIPDPYFKKGIPKFYNDSNITQRNFPTIFYFYF